jgi:glycosyltransferase involved in cell wall biosynthesis
MRLLYLDILAPMPDRHASSVRTHQLLTLLRARDIAIDFAPLMPPERREQAETIRALGINPLPWLDESGRRRFLTDHAREYDIIVCAWTTVARRFIDTAREAAPNAFLIFDSHDVNHVREYREARLTGSQSTLRRALNSRQREAAAIRAADCTLAITEADAAVLHALDPAARIAVVTMWCEPVATAIVPSSNILFLGHYGAAHNHDAAIHLAREIWPTIRAQHSQARLILAGSDPSAEIHALAGPDIAVPGWTADLRDLFFSTGIFAAPLRFGSGIKGKMLQAMAHGIPIVASTIAAEGIGLTDGRDYLRADSPDATATAIVRLLNDVKLSQTLAENARALLHRVYARTAVESQLDAVLAMATTHPVHKADNPSRH